jgi:uncharacterized protein YlxW (UPF0749 family)
MTDTAEQDLEKRHQRRAALLGRDRDAAPRRHGVPWLQVAVALAGALLGFLLVAQVRSTEGVGERLAAEREENLTRILAELTAQSDRLQSEITELRLTLAEFETSVEAEELALRSLQRRFDDLRVLVGLVPAEGEGILFTIEDPERAVTQELFVDAVQELRDAGAEAIAVNDVRLVASSAFSTRNRVVVVDRQPLNPPYRIAAIGPAETMASALGIPGGAIDALQVAPSVSAEVEVRSELGVPAVSEPGSFVYATPIIEDEDGDPSD